MKTNKIIMFILLQTWMSMGVQAQENVQDCSHGMYKYIGTGKHKGLIYDQYEIYTDTLKFMFFLNESSYEFEAHAADTTINSEYNTTCRFSQLAQELIEPFISPNYQDGSNPLIGVWRPTVVVKNASAREDAGHFSTDKDTPYRIVTPTHLLLHQGKGGTILPISINSKDSFEEFFQAGSETRSITWISKDTMTAKIHPHYTTWTRINSDSPMIIGFAEKAPRKETNKLEDMMPDDMLEAISNDSNYISIPISVKNVLDGYSAFRRTEFSSLDTVSTTRGYLDVAETATAHRMGCLWAREGQGEDTYNAAQDEFIQLVARGNYKEVFEYIENLEKEIAQSELPKHKKGDKFRLTPEVYSWLLEFDILKRMNSNFFLKRDKARLKAEEYMGEHFVIMSQEEIADRYCRAFRILSKLNNIRPPQKRITNDEMLRILPEDISEGATYLLNFAKSYVMENNPRFVIDPITRAQSRPTLYIKGDTLKCDFQIK